MLAEKISCSSIEVSTSAVDTLQKKALHPVTLRLRGVSIVASALIAAGLLFYPLLLFQTPSSVYGAENTPTSTSTPILTPTSTRIPILWGAVVGPNRVEVNNPVHYTGIADGADLSLVDLIWIKTENLNNPSFPWQLFGENVDCSGTRCITGGDFTPRSTGSYYIAVTVYDRTLGNCSGNPLITKEPGWKDCGPYDLETLNVVDSSSSPTPTLTATTTPELTPTATATATLTTHRLYLPVVINQTFTGGW